MEDYRWLLNKFEYIVNSSVTPAYLNHSIPTEESIFALERCKRVFKDDMIRLSESLKLNEYISPDIKRLLRIFHENGLSMDWQDKTQVEKLNQQIEFVKNFLDREASKGP
jgi:hypothetical protein